MSVVHSTSKQQGSPPNQFQNICKICKKLYKDKAGLMEHQRAQHSHQPSISIAQQIQRLQMRVEERKIKPQYSNSNGNSSESGSRVETYATLQKPPPNLMKPKLQSRKQQFHSPEGESFLREEPGRTEHSEELWPKRSKKDDDPPTIISGTLAAATAACYNPQLGSSNNSPSATASANGSNGSLPPQSPRPFITSASAPSSASAPNLTGGPIVQTKEQIFKSKLLKNPQLSKIQQNMSTAGNVVARNQTGVSSPNGKAGMNRIPIPKLMSRTKAQYQILRSQVTRPKALHKSGVNVVSVPMKKSEEHGGVPSSTPTPTPTNSQPVQSLNRLNAPTLQKVGNPVGPRMALPPTLHKQGQGVPKTPIVVSVSGAGRQGNKLPPPKTIPTIAGLDSVETQRLGMGARRGTGAVNHANLFRGRGGGLRGRGTGVVSATRRESLHSPPGSDGSGSDSDEYGFSTPSPPPIKTFRKSDSLSPTRGGGRKPTVSSSKKISASVPSSKKKDGEIRIYGKGYNCPPMDKVASHLNKRGVRIWICLVCEETEQEISRGPMICCDGCEDWYHFFCVGIDHEPPEHEKWFCKRCLYKKLHIKRPSDSDSGSPPSSSGSVKAKGNSSTASPSRNRGRGGKAGRGTRGGRGRGRK